MVNNGSLHYDHDRDGTHTIIAGCESPFRGRETDTLVAIRYQNDRLTVSTDIDGKNVWKECFAASDVRLPSYYYFGFSSATGDLTDNHDIISIHTYQLDTTEQRRTEERRNIRPNAPQAEPERPHVDDVKGSGWSVLKIFFLIIFLIIVCVGVGVGAYYYVNQRQYHRARFY
jgi:mannose-binding lectin 2